MPSLGLAGFGNCRFEVEDVVLVALWAAFSASRAAVWSKRCVTDGVGWRSQLRCYGLHTGFEKLSVDSLVALLLPPVSFLKGLNILIAPGSHHLC